MTTYYLFKIFDLKTAMNEIHILIIQYFITKYHKNEMDHVTLKHYKTTSQFKFIINTIGIYQNCV